jgi:hypothetical protein
MPHIEQAAWLRGWTGAPYIAAVNFFWFIYDGSGVTGRVLIPGLADFAPTFNRGVSFGLLAQNSPRDVIC